MKIKKHYANLYNMDDKNSSMNYASSGCSCTTSCSCSCSCSCCAAIAEQE